MAQTLANDGSNNLNSTGSGIKLRANSSGVPMSHDDVDTNFENLRTKINEVIGEVGTNTSKLAGIATGANNYSLPLATHTAPGGIELFSNTDQSVAANSVTSTANRTYGIQLNSANQAVVNVPWSNTTYSSASSSSLGLSKLGSNTQQNVGANNVTSTASRTYAVQHNSADQLVVNVPWSNTNTTYSTATSSTPGLVKIGYSETGKNYPVELSSGKMYVNVPWVNTDTNTTYTAGTGISISGTTISATGGGGVSLTSAEEAKLDTILDPNFDYANIKSSSGYSQFTVTHTHGGTLGASVACHNYSTTMDGFALVSLVSGGYSLIHYENIVDASSAMVSATSTIPNAQFWGPTRATTRVEDGVTYNVKVLGDTIYNPATGDTNQGSSPPGATSSSYWYKPDSFPKGAYDISIWGSANIGLAEGKYKFEFFGPVGNTFTEGFYMGWNGRTGTNARSAFYPSAETKNNINRGVDLGANSFRNRWEDIYAENATVQTSDRKLKQDIAELSDAEKATAVACKGLIRKYRLRAAVEEKGENARIHIGVIAQDIVAAFEANGLDPFKYSLLCSTTEYKNPNYTSEVNLDTKQLVNGPEYSSSPKDGWIEETTLSVRYEELLAFIISAL